MKWIKASERLPEEVGWKITRNIPSDLSSVSALFFYNGEWLDDCNNGANNVADGILPTFEWLDEYCQDGLIEALEKILSLPIEWNEAKQIARRALGNYKYLGRGLDGYIVSAQTPAEDWKKKFEEWYTNARGEITKGQYYVPIKMIQEWIELYIIGYKICKITGKECKHICVMVDCYLATLPNAEQNDKRSVATGDASSYEAKDKRIK